MKCDFFRSTSVNSEEQVKPRSLRFTWSMKTTSSRDPNDIMAEIRKVDIQTTSPPLHNQHWIAHTKSKSNQLAACTALYSFFLSYFFFLLRNSFYFIPHSLLLAHFPHPLRACVCTCACVCMCVCFHITFFLALYLYILYFSPCIIASDLILFTFDKDSNFRSSHPPTLNPHPLPHPVMKINFFLIPSIAINFVANKTLTCKEKKLVFKENWTFFDIQNIYTKGFIVFPHSFFCSHTASNA